MPKRREIKGAAGMGFLSPFDPSAPTSLTRWNLVLPGQHPLWRRYVLALCHLREEEGLRPAYRESPETTHEITVFAIDPAFSEAQFQKGGMQTLAPVNHVVQFTAVSDAQAQAVADAMALQLVEGKQLAEPSGIQGARKLFRDAIQRLLSPEAN